ncbi:MAG: hypothetical protein OCD76_01685 [Reichenbachiella sp.]
MFTEFEIETLIEIEVVQKATFELRKEFIKKEAPYLELSDQDFFSLIMMSPTIGVALADDNVSFFEEMAMNKKARKLSKGGFFFQKDPVVFAMKYLLKNYNNWEDKFLHVIRVAMESSFDVKGMEEDYDREMKVTTTDYRNEILHSPYIFIRFLSSFFVDDDEDIFSVRTMDKVDFERMLSIGKKLGFDKIPLFHHFSSTIEVK